jgi:hypothetical protein
MAKSSFSLFCGESDQDADRGEISLGCRCDRGGDEACAAIDPRGTVPVEGLEQEGRVRETPRDGSAASLPVLRQHSLPGAEFLVGSS